MLTPFNLAAALLIRLWPSTRLCFGRIFALGELLVVALFGHGLLLLSFRVVKDIGSPRGLTLALLLVLALGGLMAVVILVQRRRARTRPTATLWKPAATLVVLSLGGTAAYATLASATPEEPATTGAPALVPASAIASPSLLPAVILLSIDTLRADHLGSYGYERETTPARDRMHPVCAGPQSSPWTLPSHATMFTGRYPVRHGARFLNNFRFMSDDSSSRLRDDHLTLAELLNASGYRTAAFTSVALLSRALGLGQGFEVL